MRELRFEWDVMKAAANLRKHHVSFEEAATIWNDEHHLIDVDVVHSTEQEYREQALGLSQRLRLLLVIFTEKDEAIRLISARRATKAETRRYAGEN